MPGPVAALILAVIAAVPSLVPAAAAGEGDAPSFSPDISADGATVAFASRAATLAAGDTNGTEDVLVHGEEIGRASVASDGTEGDGPSFSPSVSGDGRYVAFESEATTLVAGDTNGVLDVFLRDLGGGTTTRVSVASDGTPGDGRSFNPSMSGDGRFVAFGSEAANLVPGDTNATEDVFVRESATGRTTLVSVASDDTPGDGRSFSPSVSGDGRFVAFASFATNLVPGDTNGAADVFVHDRESGRTTRAGAAEGDGRSFSPSMSPDGGTVAFASFATNLVPGDTNEALDVFVHDLTSGSTDRVSVASDGTQADGLTFSPAISADGRFVAFKSEATNLVAGDTNGADDVFVHDRTTRRTMRVSVDTAGRQADGASVGPSITADGRFVAFSSSATNLVPEDRNGVSDVFVHDRITGRTTRSSALSG